MSSNGSVSETGASRVLADFAAGLSLDAVPAEVAARAKTLVLDTVGIAVRGRAEAPCTPSLLATLRALGYGDGPARVIGDPDGWTPPGAALLNGALAHSLDFDDTHAAGSLHPSAPIVPAALAAAEIAGADGATTLAGIIAGYEVQIRLSLALGPPEHYARGFHPTATCGAFGAAAAAGRVLGLDGDRITAAFGAALSQAAGSLEFLEEGAWTKPFQVGWAAHSGLVAACLAKQGFQGVRKGVEGKRGFLAAYAPNPDPSKATAGLGSVWETLGIAVKPYPSCRFTHAAMDALAALKAEHGIEASEVEAARIGLPATGMGLVADPHAAKINPKSIVDGQFSMPFLAAVVLSKGGMGWDDYPIRLADQDTLMLTRRISTYVDERCEAAYPANLSGVATVETGRGRFEAFVEVPKGEPGNWPSDAEHRAKFDSLVAPVLPRAQAAELADALLTLETRPSAASVLDLSRPAPAALRAAGED